MGADDFLTKPVDDMQLMARVKSLVRLKALTDELRARAQTGQQIAIEDAMRAMDQITTDGGSILIVDTDARHAERIRGYLTPEHKVDVLTQPADAVFQVTGRAVRAGAGRHVAGRFRSAARLLADADAGADAHAADHPDGRRDATSRAWCGRSTWASTTSSCGRSSATSWRRGCAPRSGGSAMPIELRQSVNNTLALAVTDELTGLYNRRYFDRHLA